MNPLICPMSSSNDKEVSEETLAESNLNGFNNNVGSATNKASAIRDKMFWFEEDSEEFKELFKREQSIQRIQQSIIDSIKNGYSEQVPRSWYDNSKNVIIDQEYLDKLLESDPDAKLPELDDESTIKVKKFNQKIVADKKPYYFAYIYPEIMSKIKKYNDNWKHNCLRLCGLTLDELITKENRTAYEDNILDVYYQEYPVNDSPSVMNTICHKIENEFDSYFTKKDKKREFDYEILKTGVEYDKSKVRAISKLQREYKDGIKDYYIKKRNGDSDVERDSEVARKKFVEYFKNRASILVNDEDELCDIILDITYGKNKNHQFAWDICGDTIIKNLLKKNNNKISYFVKDEMGVIEYCGETYTMKNMTWRTNDS